MSTSVTFNAVSYTIPAVGDASWGAAVSSYLIAIAGGALQKSGGAFTLTADVDFGATFGLKAPYLKSKTANIASSGVLQLAKTDTIGWRNNANGGNLLLGINASDLATFNSIALVDISTAQTLTNKTLTAPVITSPSADTYLSSIASGYMLKSTLGNYGVYYDSTGPTLKLFASGTLYLSASSGAGLVLNNPSLAAATATSINKMAITAPATSSTLAVADGKTLTASNTLTFTGTDGSSAAFGTGGTLAYVANKLSVFAATTSAELAGVISDETGSGALVFAASPALTGTPTVTSASATANALTLTKSSSTVFAASSYEPLLILTSAATQDAVGIQFRGSGSYGYVGMQKATNNIVLANNISGTPANGVSIATDGTATIGTAATNNYNGQKHIINGALYAGNVTSTDESGYFVLGNNSYIGATGVQVGRTNTTTGGSALILDNRTSASNDAFIFVTNQPADTLTTAAATIGHATTAGIWTLGTSSSTAQHVINGSLKITKSLILTRVDDASSTGTINAQASANIGWTKFTASTTITLNGINPGVDGQRMVVTNVTGNVLTLTHNSGSAVANGTIRNAGLANISLGNQGSIEVIYDSSTGVWWSISK